MGLINSEERHSLWALWTRVGHSLILKMSDRSFIMLIFALSFFLKEQKSNHSFGRSFWKSERAITLFIALLKIAKKERSLIRSSAKSDKRSDRSIAFFKWANERAITLLERAEMSDEQMSDWAIAQPCSQGWPLAHFENERSLFF